MEAFDFDARGYSVGYVRLGNGIFRRTQHFDIDGLIINVDLDILGNPIGVEILRMK